MSRGKCKYINPYENDCGRHGEMKTSPKILEIDNKIKSMVTGNLSINDVDRHSIWDDVERRIVMVNPVCTGPTKNGSVILNFNAVKCRVTG